MNTMYETLMNIPLFKGVSHDQISSFVEKTPLHFHTFNEGELVAGRNDLCSNVVCLLTGSLRIERLAAGGQLRVTEVIEGGSVLGLSSLFGLDHRYNFDAYAVSERVGVMEFTKEQYRRLLENNPICQINCLNYLARRGQKCNEVLRLFGGESFARQLASLVLLATDSGGEDIRVISTEGTLADIFSSKNGDIHREMQRLADRGLISIFGETEIRVTSRLTLLDAAE